MVQNEYILQIPTPHDRRSCHVKLSQKGLDLYKKFDRIFQNHAEGLNKKEGKETLALLGSSLQKLERFWHEVSSKDKR